ncbi:hypothetical protein KM043_003266 [Ampulex compressa]|nr:hypothetical protein KM043_003266 [Ampulex compressa]
MPLTKPMATPTPVLAPLAIKALDATSSPGAPLRAPKDHYPRHPPPRRAWPGRACWPSRRARLNPPFDRPIDPAHLRVRASSLRGARIEASEPKGFGASAERFFS